MSSIPLVALNAKTPEQPDLADQFGKLMQLKNMQTAMQQQQAEAPLRQQALQQQVQAGQLQNQQAQQSQADNEAFRASMQDPAMQGKTLGQVADALAQQGKISQQSWQTWKKADVDQRKELAGLDTTKLDNAAKAANANKQLLESVSALPDDQIAANWPQIVQQYSAIPGNEKMPLNPNQPLTKDQIGGFGPMLALHQTYIDDEMARRANETKQQTAEVDLQQKQQNAQFGPSGQAADAKYVFLQSKLAAKQPISPADQTWMKGYEKQKTLVKTTVGAGNSASSTGADTPDIPLIDPKKKPNLFSIAQDMAYGKLTMQGFRTMYAYSRDANAKQSLYATAKALNPGFNSAQFEMGYTLAKNPKVQQQLASLDNVIQAAPDLINASNQAARGGIKALNNIVLKGGAEFGNKKYSNFHTAQIAFADELSGALGYGSATDMSREMGFNMTDEKLSPDQFSSSIQDIVLPFVNRKRQTLLNQMGVYGQEGMNPAASAPKPGSDVDEIVKALKGGK